MIGGSYSASDQPVTTARGWASRVDADPREAWAAGLTSENCVTLTCGQTFLLLAPERGGTRGHWQCVWDHVETWSDALAIWAHLRALPHVSRVRCLPSAKLRALPAAVVGAAAAAMRAQGWALWTGDEWVIERIGGGDNGQ